MIAVALADTKARLSELVALAEKGEAVSILRRGKPVARLVAEEKQRPCRPIDREKLERFAATMPRQEESAGDFFERIRSADRL